MDFLFAEKPKTLALGVYPEVPLAEARERRDEARKKLTNSIDPMAERQATKLSLMHSTENSFEAVALAINHRQ